MSAIAKYEPFRELERMSNELSNRFFSTPLWRAFDDEFFNRPFGNPLGNPLGSLFNSNALSGAAFAPRVDVAEDEKHLYLHVELPGLEKENVSVTVNDDGVLTIKGERKQESEDSGKGKNYLRVERSYGSFVRSFTLPETVKADTIQGAFDKGVLTLTLEKTEVVKPKEIPVEIK
jgi:HSP20 family protein